MLINTATISIAAISGSFPENRNATVVVVVVTIIVFFGVRLLLPSGMFAYNKASQRIIHWYPTHYYYGKVLQAGGMLKQSSLAQNTIRLMKTAIENMQKKDTVSGKLNLALSHEWLGILYRMMNEFEKAQKEFDAGLSVLERLNAGNLENREVRDALGHVIFRLAELDHVQKRYQRALLKYKKSLGIDESLGLQQRVNITRKLIQQITDEMK
jgi:tetratricopeptide (TPR) repeat protein